MRMGMIGFMGIAAALLGAAVLFASNCAGLRNITAALAAGAEMRLIARARFAQHSDAAVTVKAAPARESSFRLCP
jgi:hypothetical protein